MGEAYIITNSIIISVHLTIFMIFTGQRCKLYSKKRRNANKKKEQSEKSLQQSEKSLQKPAEEDGDKSLGEDN